MRANMDDPNALKRLLEVFFAFEPLEVTEFRQAIERFKADLPDLLEVLRQALSAAGKTKNSSPSARFSCKSASRR